MHFQNSWREACEIKFRERELHSFNQKLAASLSKAFLKDVSIDQEHNSSILETETAGSAFLPIQFQVSY
jgi:hypothetical protein